MATEELITILRTMNASDYPSSISEDKIILSIRSISTTVNISIPAAI